MYAIRSYYAVCSPSFRPSLSDPFSLGAFATGGLLRIKAFYHSPKNTPNVSRSQVAAVSLAIRQVMFDDGAAAQFGIFTTLVGAIAFNFNMVEAASIGIIGGADSYNFV